MDNIFFNSDEKEEIYKNHPEIREKETALENAKEKIMDDLAEEKLNQIEKLTIVKKTLNPQTNFRSNDSDIEEIIGYLFDIVKANGLVIAIETVKKMDNPFILDKFHDELIFRGILKDIKR